MQCRYFRALWLRLGILDVQEVKGVPGIKERHPCWEFQNIMKPDGEVRGVQGVQLVTGRCRIHQPPFLRLRFQLIQCEVGEMACECGCNLVPTSVTEELIGVFWEGVNLYKISEKMLSRHSEII